MKKIVLFIMCIFIFTIFIGCLNAEEVVYTDYFTPAEYSAVLGNEFPGTEANFRWEKAGYNSTGCLAIDYNFHETGMYCQVRYDYPASESETGFSFMAKGVPNSSVMIRVTDKSGETYQTRFIVETADWKKYVVNFADLEKSDHWGGDANNKIDYPLGSFFIGAEKTSVTKGTLYIDNLSFISTNGAELKNSLYENAVKKLYLTLDTGKSGNLFYPTDSLVAKIVVKDCDLSNLNAIVDLVYKNGYGSEIKTGVKRVILKGLSSNTIILPKINGVCEIDYTAKIGNNIKKGMFSYGVIPNNSKIALGKSSYFGVNCHFNQGWDPYFGKIVKRAGISWVRDGEANLNDKALPVAKENGLEYMPCFTGMQEKSMNYIKEEIANGKSYKDSWDFSPYIQDFGEYAKKYGDYVDVYDMLNEPNNMGWNAAIGGDWSGGPWIGVFYQWSTQASKLVKENDPNNKASVLWEDMEGWQWSDEYIKYGVNKELDYISPHPYNLHRSVPLPEKQHTLNSYDQFWQRNKDTGRDWKLIVGEVGFSSFELTENTPGGAGGFYSPCTRSMQAAYLVRMMIMHLTAGVERIFWYDLRNDGINSEAQENNFGLTFNDGSPKPAIVAYSNVINQCEGAKWLGRIDNLNAYMYAFLNRNGEKVICAWVTEGKSSVSMNTSKTAKIVDIFGNESKIIPKNGKLNINLSVYPIFISGI